MPTANKAAYREHAEAAAVVFEEHGALSTVECRGDDGPEGEVTSFPMTVKCREDETVCSSWILWPSREIRNEAVPRIMADARLQPHANPMPFDGARMIYGGFEVVADI